MTKRDLNDLRLEELTDKEVIKLLTAIPAYKHHFSDMPLSFKSYYEGTTAPSQILIEDIRVTEEYLLPSQKHPQITARIWSGGTVHLWNQNGIGLYKGRPEGIEDVISQIKQLNNFTRDRTIRAIREYVKGV